MKTRGFAYFKHVFRQLNDFGFLLESDPTLPSVCSLVTGAPVRGSWWSHALAHEIFGVNQQLEDHPDVLITKLISGKVTFVHKRLWPQLFAIGSARESWQMKGLSVSAYRMLQLIVEHGPLRTDDFLLRESAGLKPGDIARELEKKLLIHAEEVHTEAGAHAKLLETWDAWAKRNDFKATAVSAPQARMEMEKILGKLNRQWGGAAKLPWM